MPTIPGTALPFPKIQMFTNNGDPAAGYKLAFFTAGTATPQDTFSDSLLTTPNTNPVILDSNGRATIFISPLAYKVVYRTDADVQVWEQDNVLDVGAVFFNQFGKIFVQGARNVTSGYTVLSTDMLITVQSTGGPNPCIINLPAATRTLPIAIKNIGSIPLSVVPNGVDTIEGFAGAYAVPALGANRPTIWLWPDGVSGWWIPGGLPATL